MSMQHPRSCRCSARQSISLCGAVIALGVSLVACGGGSAPPTPTPAAAILETPAARVSTLVAPVVETPIARVQTSVADIPTKVGAVLETPAARVSAVVGSLAARSPGVLPIRGACPADHAVKGRLEQLRPVYHLPGSADYDQVKPEICFATEADAQAAGFHLAGS